VKKSVALFLCGHSVYYSATAVVSVAWTSNDYMWLPKRIHYKFHFHLCPTVVYVCADAIRCVPGEGMPLHKRPHDKGNMYIKFEIIFPPNNFVDPAKITVCIHFFS